MTKIGLIAASCKPYHAGHHKMILRSATECDKVKVYVSLSDRRRSGEKVPILGSDMSVIWGEVIAPTLPQNVELVYGGAPIGNVWKELGGADHRGSTDTYVLYADAEDLGINFHDGLLERYCERLFRSKLIERAATERAGSGTKMREMLAKGDREGFISGLPEELDRSRVWDILSTTALNPPKVKTTSQPKKKPAPVPKGPRPVINSI